MIYTGGDGASMPENKQCEMQQPGSSSKLLRLRAHNIFLLVEELGIISNEIQAFGSLLEAIGAAVTYRGNIIGREGFHLETLATRLHIASVLQELQEKGGRNKSSLLLQLRAYDLLLAANMMGIESNEIQAFGAAIQTAAGAIIAYGNLLTVKAFEIETISTRLQIIAELQDLEKEQNRTGFDISPCSEDADTSHPEHIDEKPQLGKVYLKIEQMQETIDRQQAQIQEIQKALKRRK
jgi:hypothetical protein